MNVEYDRYFLSYSGVKLPLTLVNELQPEEVANRNTYFGIKVDEQGRTVLIHKLVYAEIELEHKYEYGADNKLMSAEIRNADNETQFINYR